MGRWALVVLALHAGPLFAQPVTNGAPATEPAVVALVTATDQIVCTASVIGPHAGITAAHCVAGDPTKLRAFFGSTVGQGGTTIAVSDARAHPGFDPGGRDLAMFTLREAAPVTPLVLAGPLDASLVGTMFRVVGYGLTTGQGSDDSGLQREGTARVASLRAEDFVAVPGPSLSCLGDSGGPALVAGAIAGVVSRVDIACTDQAVYTRIDVARDVLVDPYLAETAAGVAQEGDACFYAEHCAAGLECSDSICAPEGCGGCTSSDSSSLAIVLALLLLSGSRRARTC